MKRAIILVLLLTVITCGAAYAFSGAFGTAESISESEAVNVSAIVSDLSPTETEEEYLTELVSEGYDAEWIADIYEFYLTCGEDVSIIKSIYEISESHDINGRNWIETSYNLATDGVHGELDLNDVILYVSKGVSESDIEAANIMCRSGKYTIQEILDKIIDGDTVESIADEIYNNAGETVESKARMKKHNLKEEPEMKRTIKKVEDAVLREAKIKAVGQRNIEKYDRHSLDKLYNARKLSEERNIPMEEIIDEYERLGKYSKYIDR